MIMFSLFIMFTFIVSMVVLVGLHFKFFLKNPHLLYLRVLKVSTIITLLFNIIFVYYTHHIGAMLTCLSCVYILKEVEIIYVRTKHKI